jgi:lipopolysaccharide/colanic/teichoic acid biosynthesis glycosyltransferase
MITLRQPKLEPFERRVKRAFDLVVSAAVIAITLPLMALIALAIRIDSPGPAIFKQERVGENGRIFFMYKFRSMLHADTVDTRQREPRIMHNKSGAQKQADRDLLDKQPHDPRVTRVGKVLRRASLDELPQLFNVLRGEMSLVGPRPELPWLVQQYEPWQWQRLAVPQGMTGWWQVNGRHDQPMILHTEQDMFYIQHYSLLLDLQILWQTLAAVVKGKGAY